MASWSTLTWQKHLPIYKTTQQTPFIQELITGKLDPLRFHFYIEQDARYLQSFTQLLKIMAKRVEPARFQAYFHTFVEENMAQEQALHDLYLQKPLTDITPTATCLAFIQYNATLETLPPALALAGMLPCFLVYQQLGRYIYDHHIRKENPYLDWIDTYAGIEHLESVTRLREMCDAYAQNSDPQVSLKMDEWYEKGCQLDQKFWQNCYQMR